MICIIVYIKRYMYILYIYKYYMYSYKYNLLCMSMHIHLYLYTCRFICTCVYTHVDTYAHAFICIPLPVQLVVIATQAAPTHIIVSPHTTKQHTNIRTCAAECVQQHIYAHIFIYTPLHVQLVVITAQAAPTHIIVSSLLQKTTLQTRKSRPKCHPKPHFHSIQTLLYSQ